MKNNGKKINAFIPLFFLILIFFTSNSFATEDNKNSPSFTWQSIFEKYSTPECIETRDYNCLRQRIIETHNLLDNGYKYRDDYDLKKMVLRSGDEALAAKILSYEKFQDDISLLFTTKEYDKALSLAETSENQLNSNKGEIAFALYKSKKFEDAPKILDNLEKLNFKPKGGAVPVSHHCHSINEYEAYPKSYALFVMHYSSIQNYKDAEAVLNKLKNYIDQNTGKLLPCDLGYALGSYTEGAYHLAQAYVENGNRDKATIILDEVLKTISQNGKDSKKSYYKKHAFVLAFLNLNNGIDEIAELIVNEPIGLYEYNNQWSDDPVAMVYFMSQNDEKFLNRLNHINELITDLETKRNEINKEKKEEYKNKSDPLSEWRFKTTYKTSNPVDVKISTIKASIRIGMILEEKERVMALIDQLNSIYINNFEDLQVFNNNLYLTQLYWDLGMKDKSKEVFDLAFSRRENNKLNDGYVNQNNNNTILNFLNRFYGSEKALNWLSKNKDEHYPQGWRFTPLITELIENENWPEYNFLLSEGLPVRQSAPNRPIEIYAIANKLIEEQHFDRALTLATQTTGYDFKHVMSVIITEAMNDEDIPQHVLNKAWEINMDRCNSDETLLFGNGQEKPAPRRMYDCLSYLSGVDNSEMKLYQEDPLNKGYGL